MARMSKYYNITDIEALMTFNNKAVQMEPVINHSVVMGLLRLFDEVPGVERIADVEPETTIEEKIATSDNVQELADKVTETGTDGSVLPNFLGKRSKQDAA